MTEDLKKIREELLGLFPRLCFAEQGHKYTVNNVEYTSVSKIIENFIPKKDFNKIAKITAKKRGVDVNDLLGEWKKLNVTACDLGSETHNFGEIYVRIKFFDEKFNLTIDPSHGHKMAVLKFWKDLPSYIIPIVVEFRMFSSVYQYAGTLDILLYNTKTGKFIIGDYKTNKDIFKNFKHEKMLSPFNDLLDMPYNHYQVQFSLYELLLKPYNIEIEERWLIWLHKNGNYQVYRTTDYTNRLKNWFDENRRSNIKS
jgi:hypothetical protein